MPGDEYWPMLRDICDRHGVLLIADSHFSIHTWPEDGFVGVDIFTCGEEMDPDIAIAVLTEGLRAETVKVKVLLRGQLDTSDSMGSRR